MRDVARANALAVEQPGPPGSFRALNVASGRPCRIGDVALLLATAAGGLAPVVTGEYRLGDVRHVVASPHLARATLGFSADVDLEHGLQEFATAPLRGQ